MTIPAPLAEWLQRNGLERHLSAFVDNDIDFDLVADLSNEDLRELGLSIGDRKRFFRAVAELASDHAANRTEAEPPAPQPTSRPNPDETLQRGPGQASEPAPPQTQAHRRQLTVMFCDLVGSTELAARMDPEDLRQLTRSYQDLADAVVRDYEGSVARLLGDGVLAYFGFPQAHEDDAERAIRAALDLIARIPSLPTPSDEPPLQVRIGIATGLVVVADLNANDPFSRGDVFGETPNLAARLQTLAEPNTVVVAHRTRLLAGDSFEFHDLGRRPLKGFSKPIPIWRVDIRRLAVTPFDSSRADDLTELVGRDSEHRHIETLWQQAREGQGQALILRGEAGIGKSRLVRTLWEAADLPDHYRLLNRCSPFTTRTALAPVIDELSRVAGIVPGDTDKRRLHKLTAVGALSTDADDNTRGVLTHLLGITLDPDPLAGLSADEIKELTQQVLIERLLHLTGNGPVLYLVEDAHWVDPSTQELLHQLLPKVADHRLMVLIAARPEFAPDWATLPPLSTLNLERLDAVQGLEMVHHLSGNVELPAQVSSRILNRADGNPLFIEEITRLVIESDLLERRGHRYLLQGTLSQLAIPETLQDSLIARIDRLSVSREVAQIGATLGREFSHAMIARVVDFAEPQLERGLARLLEAGVLFSCNDGPDRGYQFKHALLQEAAYQSQLKTRRREIHRRVVEALEQQTADGIEQPPELLAHHCGNAGLIERAIPYWQQAGDQALAQSAHAEASGHLQAGMDLLDPLPPGQARDALELTLRLSLGVALTATHGYGSPEVHACYSRAAVLALQLGQTEQLFPALYGLWWGTLLQSQYGHARELGDELLELAEAGKAPAFRVSAHRALGATLFYSGELRGARRQFELAATIPPKAAYRRQTAAFDVVDPWIVSRCYLGGTLWLLGDEAAALHTCEQSIDAATRLAHPFTLALAHNAAARMHQLRNDRTRTHHHATQSLALARRHGFVFWIGWASIIGAWAGTDGRSYAQRIEAMNRGVKEWEGAGPRLGLTYFRALLADTQAQHGDYEAALSNLTLAREQAVHSSELWWAPEMHRLEGDVLLGRAPEHPQPAAAAYRRAIALAEERHSLSLAIRASVSLARLQQRLDDSDAACRTLRSALSHDLPVNAERDAAAALLSQMDPERSGTPA